MNIERSCATAAEDFHTPSALEALYAAIPYWNEILPAVRAGRAEFVEMLTDLELADFGLATSAVHAYHEIELHAFILGIVSAGRFEEIRTKSFLTYASHWIDDFFDSPGRVPDPARLLADRHDIRLALANMGRIGRVGFAMAARALHPEAIYKTLHRMLYGGLVQRSGVRRERRALVEEYRAVAGRFVAPRLVDEIRALQAEAYWTTNKSVLEISNAAEQKLDFNAAELWNLVYAPALYYQDADEERARGELNFTDEEAPQLQEMIRMIRLGGRYLTRRYEASSPHMQQLGFVARTIPNLPPAVVREYQSLIDRAL